jgi:hypothetical protein
MRSISPCWMLHTIYAALTSRAPVPFVPEMKLTPFPCLFFRLCVIAASTTLPTHRCQLSLHYKSNLELSYLQVPKQSSP